MIVGFLEGKTPSVFMANDLNIHLYIPLGMRILVCFIEDAATPPPATRVASGKIQNEDLS